MATYRVLRGGHGRKKVAGEWEPATDKYGRALQGNASLVPQGGTITTDADLLAFNDPNDPQRDSKKFELVSA